MIYLDQPISPATARHAISYLHEAQMYVDTSGCSSSYGLRAVANAIKIPRRAIDVARKALIQAQGDIEVAIEELEP